MRSIPPGEALSAISQFFPRHSGSHEQSKLPIHFIAGFKKAKRQPRKEDESEREREREKSRALKKMLIFVAKTLIFFIHVKCCCYVVVVAVVVLVVVVKTDCL